MKTLTRITAAVMALAFLGLVMAYLAGFFSATIAPEPVTPSPGSADTITTTVEAVEQPIIEQAPGTLHAKKESMISARITGSIAAIYVRAGDTVSKDDVMVELDRRELESRLSQRREAVAAAQAHLEEVKPNHERISKLFERGVVAKAELDRVEASLKTARADLQRARQALSEAETMLSYAIIRAPISGRVADRYADPGDTAMPGKPLLRLYQPGSLRLEADVPESMGTDLSIGRELQVIIDAPQKVFKGSVDEIVPMAQAGSRTFLVKVSLPQAANLYPGMFGRLMIPVGTATRLYIPAAALLKVGQIEFVYVPGQHGPVRRYVRTGETTDEDRVAILSGLQAGEAIILPSSLQDAPASETR